MQRIFKTIFKLFGVMMLIVLFYVSIISALSVLYDLRYGLHWNLWLKPNEFYIPNSNIEIRRIFTTRKLKIEFKNFTDSNYTISNNFIIFSRQQENYPTSPTIYIKPPDSLIVHLYGGNRPDSISLPNFKTVVIEPTDFINQRKYPHYKLLDMGYYRMTIDLETSGFSIVSPDTVRLFQNFYDF